MDHIYVAIDLKSFYASVECVERKLDPLDANLVVADNSRTEKTICLAVSPGLKSYGIPGRPRLFEVTSKLRDINAERKYKAPGKQFSGKSIFASELKEDPALEVDYVCATPRMALYMKYSTNIYKIYLKYVAPEDVLVYSCDEVFIDVTSYLSLYHCTAHELALKMVRDVLSQTGITATAGIGTNLFLAKIAMDIVAKKMPADADGVRIAELDERGFREKLWDHKPITDFWRVGAGTARRLAKLGLFTMGDVAQYSESCEDVLYKTFGVNAELIIDHAWGWEPCTIGDAKSFKPQTNSLSQGQVMTRPYEYKEAGLIVREMAELLSLDLVRKGLVTDQIVLTIGYESVKDAKNLGSYEGELTLDRYGRITPKHAHGTWNLDFKTSSTKLIREAAGNLYERIMDKDLCMRRLSIAACNIIPEGEAKSGDEYEQLSLFTDFEKEQEERRKQEIFLEKEKNLQKASLEVKQKYGKNAIIKGMNLLDGATTITRNAQIGGHRA